MNSMLRRVVTTAGATVGAVALLSGTALAHECYIGTKNLNGPASANWEHITVAQAAGFLMGFEAECAEQDAAGVAALRDGGLPLSIKIFMRSTLAESANPKTVADGKGMEHLDGGSTVAFEAVGTYVDAASATAC